MRDVVGAFVRRTCPLVILFAAACTDGVVDSSVSPPAPGVPGRAVTLQQVLCTGDLSRETVVCGRPAESGASADILYGGQNLYVKLTSSNAAYNGGTGQFTFDVTVQNLIEQPVGTVDGTTLDPSGIRVFFSSGPTVTGGTGSASVVPDGFATFTAAGQPFYQYNELLENGETSAARTWTLIMPPTVTTFSFLLFISSPVEYPDGYITLDGTLPGADYGALRPTTTHGMTAQVKTAVGNAVAGAVVSFSSSDSDCATVDPATGLVTGVRAATCTITASSTVGGIPVTGTMTVDVTGMVRNWEGDVSTDWSNGGNWAGGLVPAAVDSVLVPIGVPNYPALVASTPIGGVEVADGATLSLGAFDLTVSANLATGSTAGSGVLGTTGYLVLAGSGGTVHGRVPRTRVTGSYSLSGNLYGTAPEEVDAGELTVALYEMQIDSQ